MKKENQKYILLSPGLSVEQKYKTITVSPNWLQLCKQTSALGDCGPPNLTQRTSWYLGLFHFCPKQGVCRNNETRLTSWEGEGLCPFLTGTGAWALGIFILRFLCPGLLCQEGEVLQVSDETREFHSSWSASRVILHVENGNFMFVDQCVSDTLNLLWSHFILGSMCDYPHFGNVVWNGQWLKVKQLL